jgi:hypothetical protein
LIDDSFIRPPSTHEKRRLPGRWKFLFDSQLLDDG